MAAQENRSVPLRVVGPAERERLEPGESFVGREHELAQLERALDKAVAGHGRIFVVSGEPGIGKSRLADEFSALAHARGLRVVWGRCFEGSGAPAYWPIVQIIRACAERPDFAQLTETLGERIEQVAALAPELVRLVPSHGERAGSGRIDPEQARFRLFDAVATLLRSIAHREPLVIVIDDLHDADLGALQMVRFLARALKDCPFVLLGTHREAEVERSPERRALFAEMVRESDLIPLRGLSQSDTANLVRDRIGIDPDANFLATLHQTTGGNPLFLIGVVQMLMAEGKLEHLASVTAADLKLPVSVRSAISYQLIRLSERTKSVLAVASAVGIESELMGLERIAKLAPADILDCLDEAAGAGIGALAAQSRGHWRFAHALIRAAIYDSHASKERAELHRRIADTLEELHATSIDSHLSELAHHYVEAVAAGAADKAIDYSIRAGKAANDIFAYEEAISHWQIAAALIAQHGLPRHRHASLLADLGLLLQQNNTSSGIEELESAVKLYEESNMHYEAASVRQRLGQILASPGEAMDTERAFDNLQEAEAVLGKGPDSPSLASLYYGLGQVSRNKNHIRDAIAAMERAMIVAERSGAEGAWNASATQVALFLLQTGRISEGRTILETVRQRLPEIKDPPGYFGTVWAGGGCSSQLLDYAKAREWWQQGLDSPMLLNYQHWVMDVHIAHASLQTGGWVGARKELISRGLAAFCGEGDWLRSRILFQKEVDEARRSRGQEAICCTTLDLASAQRMLGEPAAAAELLEGILLEYPDDEPHVQIEMSLRPTLTLLYLEMGANEAARRQVSRCEEILAGGEDWRGLGGYAAHASAVCMAAHGQYASADDQFGAANETLNRFSLVWEEAELFHNWGRALISANQRSRAIEKLDAAIAIYRRIGAGQPWVDRVMVDLARANQSCGQSTQAKPGQSLASEFRREGEYWTITYADRTCRLKDGKGLQYIAYLLRNPNSQLSAIALAGTTANGGIEEAVTSRGLRAETSIGLEADLGCAGDILDAKAMAQYKSRLRELQDEIDRSKSMNDPGSAERARAEFDSVSEQLFAATGLGGRSRKVASHRERARVTVTKRIKGALRNIHASDPVLSRHLADSIRTGHFCCYVPAEPISWQF